MAEKQFTEAGKAGQKIRGALANAYRKFNSGFTNYVQEPLLNLYPQFVANPTYAGIEAAAGAIDVPLNLGRFPYYDIETEEERNNRLLKEVDATQEEVPVITISKPRRKTAQKMYRVMFAGQGPENSILVDTKEEADRILAKSGGKGAVAGITMSRKPKEGAKAKVSNKNYLKGELGEELPAEETKARIERYRSQMLAPQEAIAKNKEAIRKLRSPETQEEFEAVEANKERMAASWAEANKAKLAKDRESGNKFADWRSDVEARRQSTDAYNTYNKELGLLKKAYSKAKRNDDPVNAFIMSKKIREYKGDVPEEAGARAKYFKNVAVSNRDAMLAEQERLAQEEEMNRRKSAANPDYSFKPVNLTY